MRSINDILDFRTDVSPFLVHLTRTADGRSAHERLKCIIQQRRLEAGNDRISSASFGLDDAQSRAKKDYFRAVCFTETPLDQIHCLLDIENRKVNLEPYGLVFLRESLQGRGVSPVLYLNNELGDKGNTVCSLADL